MSVVDTPLMECLLEWLKLPLYMCHSSFTIMLCNKMHTYNICLIGFISQAHARSHTIVS